MYAVWETTTPKKANVNWNWQNSIKNQVPIGQKGKFTHQSGVAAQKGLHYLTTRRLMISFNQVWVVQLGAKVPFVWSLVSVCVCYFLRPLMKLMTGMTKWAVTTQSSPDTLRVDGLIKQAKHLEIWETIFIMMRMVRKKEKNERKKEGKMETQDSDMMHIVK